MRIKHTSTDARVRALIEKHSTQLAQEIQEEFTTRLLEQFEPALANLKEGTSTALTRATKPINYDPPTRCWVCSGCGFTDFRRRAVTTHARYCEGNGITIAKLPSSVMKSVRSRSTKTVKSRKKKS